MIYAFLIPLFGGIIGVASFYLISNFEIPESTISGNSRGYIFRQLITGATIWLTLGSLFKGVLDIYGTSNKLTIVFLIVGSGHILVAIPQCKIRG